MSHEIRTPLNAVIGIAEITKKSLGDTQPEVTKALDKILSVSDHLLSLLNDVLDMSKIEAGKTEIVSEPFDLLTMVKDVETMIMQRTIVKGVYFNVQFDDLTDVVVLGDTLRLKQVLINILGNAVKFTPVDNSVDFIVRIEEEGDEHITITFIVRDTGIGMTDEQTNKLFKPFQQVNASITSNFGGTGLGLYISQNLVRMMGGEIEVQSEIDKGSEFSFTLTFERATQAVESEDAAEITNIDLTGKRILLVEDIELNREILMALFCDTNATFEEAENGKVAVSMFSSSDMGHYDFILMDVKMPVMDGYTATMRIRGLDREDAKSIPIFAMTANAYMDDIKEALAAGMNGHLTKPINIKKVFDMISRHM